MGFDFLCHRGNISWIKVGYLRSIRASSVPFPRRQELPAHASVIGCPDHWRKLWVVSHGWETEAHPSPGGAQIILLVDILNRLGSDDEDVVFYDFMSLPQSKPMPLLYWNGLGIPAKPEKQPYAGAEAILCWRTREENAAFEYAMYGGGRLYSFRRCQVIVVPNLPEVFPKGWGTINPSPYGNRGWCCSEFSIALAHNRIANLDDDGVQQLRMSRQWPTTWTDYKEMMAETDANGDPVVEFTCRGDRDQVATSFFRFTEGLQPPRN